MAYYAVNYHYDPATAAGQDALRPEHRTYLGTLVEQGTLVASGPFVGITPSASPASYSNAGSKISNPN